MFRHRFDRWCSGHMGPLIEARLYPVLHDGEAPVSVDEAKAHLRIDFDDDDALISDLIEVVIDALESELRRAIVDQTWLLKLSAFPHHEIELPLPPLLAVESVSYFDSDNVLQILDPSLYEVIGVGARMAQGSIRPVTGQTWPAVYRRAEPVSVQFRAGYLTADSPPVENVPKDLKQLIKLNVADFYQNRESMVIDNVTVSDLKISEWIRQRYRVYD